MEKISFPFLNVKLEISNVAFEIFGVEIYWYAIIMISAILVAILISKLISGKFGITIDQILDLSLFAIPIAILSARIYFCLFNLDFYLKRPSQILNIRNGGLAIYGAIIGGIITAIIFCRKRKIDILDLTDFAAPCLAIGQAIGRWGNFVNVEAYGNQTQIFCRMGIYEAGKYVEVHPTFLYESIATLLIFIVLIELQNKRMFKGQITLTYFFLYSIVRTLIEGLRIDSLMLGSFRISQILSVFIFIISTILLIKFTLKYKKENNKTMSKKINN